MLALGADYSTSWALSSTLAGGLHASRKFIRIRGAIGLVTNDKLNNMLRRSMITFNLANGLVNRLTATPMVKLVRETTFLNSRFRVLLNRLLRATLVRLEVNSRRRFMLIHERRPPPSSCSTASIP